MRPPAQAKTEEEVAALEAENAELKASSLAWCIQYDKDTILKAIYNYGWSRPETRISRRYYRNCLGVTSERPNARLASL